MVRTLATALVAVTLMGMLAACGGGDDPTPEPTQAPAAATATSTTPPTATPTTEPTATSTTPPSPTAPPTRTPGPAPTRLLPTPTPRPSPTPEPTPTAPQASEVDILLSYAALTVDELGGGWAHLGTTVPPLTSDDATSFCNQPRFPDRDQRTGRLSVEFSNEELPARLTQDLVAFPYLTAIDAFAYARDISQACTEWTDDEGTTFQLGLLEDPLLGDESLAFVMQFSTPDGAAIDGYVIIVREDEYILTLTYLTLGGGDVSPLLGIMQTATAKTFAISESYFFPNYDPDFLAQSAALLLTTPEIPGGYALERYAIPSETDRYGLCNADPFPDLYAARSETAAYYHIDPEAGPFLVHSLVALENVEAADVAMLFIRESTACADWTDEFGDYYVVVDRPALALGDDAYALVTQFDSPAFGPVQISGTFIRTGSVITVLLYSQIGEIDPRTLESYGALAIGKLGR